MTHKKSLDERWIDQHKAPREAEANEALVKSIAARLGRAAAASGVRVETRPPHPAVDHRLDSAEVSVLVEHPDGPYVLVEGLINDEEELRRRHYLFERTHALREEEGKPGLTFIPTVRPRRTDSRQRAALAGRAIRRLASQIGVEQQEIFAKQQGTRNARYTTIKDARARILRALCDDEGVSQGDAARALGWTQQNVSYWVKKGREDHVTGHIVAER